MTVCTISSKGWIVIPAHLRRKYGLVPGSALRVVDYGGVLGLVPALERPIEEARGLAKGDTSLTRALLREHQAEAARGE